MKYDGEILDPKDLTTKEYVDGRVVANPSTTSSTLSSVTIQGVSYTISGGAGGTVPTPTVADAGKILQVQSDGSIAWVVIPYANQTTF